MFENNKTGLYGKIATHLNNGVGDAPAAAMEQGQEEFYLSTEHLGYLNITASGNPSLEGIADKTIPTDLVGTYAKLEATRSYSALSRIKPDADALKRHAVLMGATSHVDQKSGFWGKKPAVLAVPPADEITDFYRVDFLTALRHGAQIPYSAMKHWHLSTALSGRAPLSAITATLNRAHVGTFTRVVPVTLRSIELFQEFAKTGRVNFRDVIENSNAIVQHLREFDRSVDSWVSTVHLLNDKQRLPGNVTLAHNLFPNTAEFARTGNELTTWSNTYPKADINGFLRDVGPTYGRTRQEMVGVLQRAVDARMFSQQEVEVLIRWLDYSFAAIDGAALLQSVAAAHQDALGVITAQLCWISHNANRTNANYAMESIDGTDSLEGLLDFIPKLSHNLKEMKSNFGRQINNSREETTIHNLSRRMAGRSHESVADREIQIPRRLDTQLVIYTEQLLRASRHSHLLCMETIPAIARWMAGTFSNTDGHRSLISTLRVTDNAHKEINESIAGVMKCLQPDGAVVKTTAPYGTVISGSSDWALISKHLVEMNATLDTMVHRKMAEMHESLSHRSDLAFKAIEESYKAGKLSKQYVMDAAKALQIAAAAFEHYGVIRHMVTELNEALALAAKELSH